GEQRSSISYSFKPLYRDRSSNAKKGDRAAMARREIPLNVSKTQPVARIAASTFDISRSPTYRHFSVRSEERSKVTWLCHTTGTNPSLRSISTSSSQNSFVVRILFVRPFCHRFTKSEG